MKLDQLCAKLTCPIHLNSKLIKNNFELKCLICDSSVGIIKNSSPIKIDFINGFESGLLETYDAKSDTQKWTNWRRENLEFLLKMNIKPGLVLDIGAGPGEFHPFLNFLRIISIDFTNYPTTNIITNLNFNLPFESGIVDSILMTNILEHLFDARVIKECHRLLKKGSYLYITIPFLLDVHQIPYDYHRYTYLYLKDILIAEEFEIDYFASSGDFGTFETLVEHYYRFPIHNGNFYAKMLWQLQKTINYLLKYFVPVNYRMDYTGGYMIRAQKK